MIQIKYGNNVLFEVLETPSCERVIELMSADHVKLSWVSREGDAIPAGAYITYKGETFTLLDAYKPAQKSENEFEYAPEFGSSIMAWGKVPFFFYTVDSQGRILSREMDWSLTGGAGVFLDRICDAIEKETGETYTYSADESLPGSKNRQFSSVDILSALNDIANVFETEWWVDKANKVIHLSKCEVGTAETLTVGGNVKTPSVQMNSEGFFNRYYAFGSTRNIVQSYTGANVNNLVNKRLTLDPEEYPDGYYEPNPIPSGGKVFSKILVFDDIYPAATNFVAYDILSRQEYVLDEATGKRIQIGTDDDGNPIYDMYAVYYIKIGTKSGSTYTQYTINPWEYSEKEDRQEGPQPGREGQLLPGLNVSVHFDSGSLRGREFEVRYVKTQETYSDGGTPIIVTPGYFEIKYVKDGNYIIPDITSLFPKADDKVILFNLRMPDEYIEDAYGRLEEKMLKTIEEKFDTDLNLYTVESNPIAFEEEDPGLGIGSRVTLINGDYSLSTRVTKLTSRLDFPYVQSITVGNSLVKGTIQELKEEVVNANTSLEIIATLNSTAKAIADSYTRTQQVMIENFNKISDMFELDETSVAGKIFIRAKYDGLYSDGEISAGGAGTGGGGGGLIEDVYGYTDLGGTYSDSVKTNTFNAYTIARLASRITSLEERPQGGVTSFNTRTGAVVLTAADVNAVISYQTPISDLSTIRSQAANGNTAYGYFSSGVINNGNLPTRLREYHSSADTLDTTICGFYYMASGGPFESYHTSNKDYMVLAQGYTSMWGSQIATDFRTNRLAVRNKNNGTWNSWGMVALTSDIPTNNNQLTNGAGYITSSGSCAYATSAGNAATLENHSASYFAAASALSGYLPMSGGNITGSIKMNGGGTSPLAIRNYTNTQSGGWGRSLGDIQVDGVTKFSISAYGSYTAGTANNGIDYAYIGCNGYNGLNLRISATELKWGDNQIYHSGNSNNTSTPWSASSLTLNGAISGATNIYASGNVGIGTTSPSAKLSVFGDMYFQTNLTGANINIDSPTYTGGWMGGMHVYEQGNKVASIVNWYATGNSIQYIQIGNFGSSYNNPAIYIYSNGKVGVGTTSPSEKLTVDGNILATGEVSAGSDRRWKHGIKPVADGLSAILRLQPSEWTWNSDNHKGSGLIAQDVQSVLPHLVKADGNGYLHLAYDGFHAYEISAIQQLHKRIAELEKEIQTLKNS